MGSGPGLVTIDLPSVRRVGIVSDTHGWLHPRLLAMLQGVDAILHAGDIGGAPILASLASVAPVVAVRGNNDVGTDCSHFPLTVSGRLGCLTIWLGHIEPAPSAALAAEAGLVVFGHSHMARWQRRGAGWWLNPGAAGKRRFRSTPHCVRLDLDEPDLGWRLIDLDAAV